MFMLRSDWDEYFLNLCTEVGKRATCDRGKSACVIVKHKRIISTGYVGAPVGLPHCDDVGHQMRATVKDNGELSNHCVRTTHAEQNAICQAARFGVALDGAILYCNMEPCSICAKMIINVGIKKVICQQKYHAGQETRELFKQAGVELVVKNDSVLHYSNQ
jgi:dCMP deaminase